MEKDIKELTETRDYFLKTDVGTGSDLIKTLRKKRNDASREMEEMEDAETNMDDEYTNLSMDIKAWDEEIVSLQDELVEIKKDIAKMKTQKKGKIETRDGHTRARKTEDGSLYSQIIKFWLKLVSSVRLIMAET